MPNALEPLEPPFAPEIADVLARYPQQDGYLLRLFRTFARSERFLRRCVPNLLDKGSPLPLRIREIVILRVTANTGCEYEWGVHAAIFPGAAGLDADQVAATRERGADAPCWSPREQRLLRAIDELGTDGTLRDDTLSAFQADWSVEEQLEILALCGTYHTISFVANVARLPREPFGVPFPETPPDAS